MNIRLPYSLDTSGVPGRRYPTSEVELATSGLRSAGVALVALVTATACSAARFEAQPDQSQTRETTESDSSPEPGGVSSAPRGVSTEPHLSSTFVDSQGASPTEDGSFSGWDGGSPSVDLETHARDGGGASGGSSSDVLATSSSSLVSSSDPADASVPTSDASSASSAEETSRGSTSHQITTSGSTLASDGGVTSDAWQTGAFTEPYDDAGVTDAGTPFIDVEPPPEPGACNAGEFEVPTLVLGLGYSDRLWGPAISADGKTLFFGYTGGNEDLYRATLRPDGERFGGVTALSNLNTSSNEGTPFLSYDGLTLYFYSERSGGVGGRDLWQATRSDGEAPFTHVTHVPNVSAGSYDHLPWLSDTELTLYFTTERNGGLGRSDIWMATRRSKAESFEAPRRVPGINSGAREDAVAFSPDRLTLYFTTDREDEGNLDIWRATRDTIAEDFSNPEPIPSLNSESEDTNLAMTRDGKRLYFSSGRDGRQRIWVAQRTCQ